MPLANPLALPACVSPVIIHLHFFSPMKTPSFITTRQSFLFSLSLSPLLYLFISIPRTARILYIVSSPSPTILIFSRFPILKKERKGDRDKENAFFSSASENQPHKPPHRNGGVYASQAAQAHLGLSRLRRRFRAGELAPPPHPRGRRQPELLRRGSGHRRRGGDRVVRRPPFRQAAGVQEVPEELPRHRRRRRRGDPPGGARGVGAAGGEQHREA